MYLKNEAPSNHRVHAVRYNFRNPDRPGLQSSQDQDEVYVTCIFLKNKNKINASP